MAKQQSELNDKLTGFIQQQHLFFVGTAGPDGRVNISPKGMDSLRVIDSKRVLWLNLTGSGNETAAHIQEQSRMTLMFCAFKGRPLILRLYGTARVIHPRDHQWKEWKEQFPDIPGARQIFDMDIELVQTSCGMGVPLFDYASDREALKDWAHKKGKEGLREYWREKNQQSIDGKPTHIFS